MEAKNVDMLDEFEELLHEKDEIHRRGQNIFPQPGPQKLLRANGSASLSDFIEMVNRVLDKSMKKYNLTFSPDEGSRLQIPITESLDKPHIQFSVLRREPRGNANLRPRPREAFEDADGRKGFTYAQIFDCDVQFDILAGDYRTANEVMDAFEDAMFSYTALFKSRGVSDVYFLRQITDENLDQYRNQVSVRSLQYRVVIERVRPIYDTTIASIGTAAKIN